MYILLLLRLSSWWKLWVVSGSEGDSEGINLLRHVLGMPWDVKEDEFFYTVRINLSPKYKKVHTDSNLMCRYYKFTSIITRRMIFRQVASVFYLLGLVQPFILTAKLLLREMLMNSEGKGWDEPG